mgnify:CR=1 FL=1
MALVSVKEAANLVSKSDITLYRHIKQGKLSKDHNGKIDTSELIRVYGELQQRETTKQNNLLQHESNDVVSLLQQRINDLEQTVKELKTDAKELRSEFLARENRLMALLEHQQPKAEPKPENSAGGLFSKFFK